MDLLVLTDRYVDDQRRPLHGAAVHLNQVAEGLSFLGHTVRILHWANSAGTFFDGKVAIEKIAASSFSEFLHRACHEVATHDGPIHLNNVDCAPALALGLWQHPFATATVHTNTFLHGPNLLDLRRTAARLSALAIINRRYLGALQGVGRPVVWIPSAVDTLVMQPRRVADLDPSIFRILLPARPVRAKGVVFAAELLAVVAPQLKPRRVQLVYTGVPSEDVVADIRRAAFPYEAAIQIVPWCRYGPEMAELYQTANAVILPSTSEACGLTLLEAMACGVPVVTSPQANAAGAVRHRQTGLRASLNSPREWSECLIAIASDPGLANRLGQSGTRTVRRRHPVRAMIRSYLDLFHMTGAMA